MMANKFESFLARMAKDVEQDLSKALPTIETTGEAAVAIFVPAVSPMFNATVNAIVTAQKSAAALTLAKGTMTNQQKLAAVVGIAGPLIAKGLSDAGKPSDATAVEGYVNAVVLIAGTTPAPATP
jgi:hypothetical protein